MKKISRRQVDLIFFLIDMNIVKMFSHGGIPLVIHRQRILEELDLVGRTTAQ